MASLPPDRCTYSFPFNVTGIDFAGPFELKSSTLRSTSIVKGMPNQRPRNPAVHQCQLCYRYHSLRFCRSFLAMGPTQRNQVARNLHYCVNCLARTHVVAECSSSDTCLYCQQLHHPLLHPNRRNRTVRRSVHERLRERPGTNGSPVRNGVSVVTAIRSTTSGHTRNGNNSKKRRSTNLRNGRRTFTTHISHHAIRRRNRTNIHTNNNNQNHNQPPAPNQRILSEAIRSLAVVLCASSEP
ncbi:hypothetical protein CVS40_10442 [Lucilia cuprina]|nr:hypothetical protein CVS40_10442 [Lucilia cuprina]